MHRLWLLWAAQNESIRLKKQQIRNERRCSRKIEQMPDEVFKQHFRLSKEMFVTLCSYLVSITKFKGTRAIPVELKVSTLTRSERICCSAPVPIHPVMVVPWVRFWSKNLTLSIFVSPNRYLYFVVFLGYLWPQLSGYWVVPKNCGLYS